MGEVTALLTVFEAWANVMRDVQAISKDSRNKQQGFSFRGIDAVMNTVGPVLREHGVIVVPLACKHESERYTTKNGGQMVNRVVEMGFQVYGPAGDSFSGFAYGEAADAGDKAMTKAESVALRTFLLQSLMIPTDDPDPDAESHERQADRPTPARATTPPPPSPANLARAELKALATENCWDLGDIAARFAQHNPGKALGTATADEVKAFQALLSTGAVTV